MLGKFFLIIGPSGSGKGTLVNYLREKSESLNLVFPVSCTTRKRRPREKEGETYYFITRDEFEERIKKEEFLEWAEYGGNLYGALKSEIINPLQEGYCVVREVEIQGANSIIGLFDRSDLFVIYIDAGPWERMVKRIRERAPISEEELELRRERFEEEVGFKDQADLVIRNYDGEVDKAKEELLDTIREVTENLSKEASTVKL